ncbi:sperm flagellar protein 2-like [Macrosteles quadrilineatus]|uniref:sperm flagellar protein 2-like n=1 Tax=Macrosteles quadrilineatus TaxID=74068 RepID=UPI0023E1150E|nr:sperm flagellar protein 2-like [Macrosteles quadrilineatus]
MFGLIESWLFDQLGINCNLKKIEDGNLFQDGCVLVKILQSYGLVDDKFSGIIHSTVDKTVCKKNLKLLKPIFDMLKIKYDDTIIHGVAENKPGTTINLLYELYTCLENKQHLYFVTKNNFEEACQEKVKNIQGLSVNTNQQKPEKHSSSDFCFEQPLINNADIINWYRDKYNKVKHSLNAKLKQSKTPIAQKGKTNLDAACEPCLWKSKTDSGMIESLPELNAYSNSSGDKNLLDYKDFIAKYKIKQNNIAARKSLEKAIQYELLKSTWKKIEESQDKIYSSVLSAVLLKQSNYEKQILSKVVQAQKEVQVQNENIIWAKQSVINEQEQKIFTDFELKERFEMMEQNYWNERKRVLELHKKLYREKKEIIKRDHYNICKETVDAIVELALSATEYKLKNNMEVSKSLWNNWVQLFVKSLPVRSQLQTVEDGILEGEDVNYDEAISFEKEQDEILNEIEIDDYLSTRGRWFHSVVLLEHGDPNDKNLAAIAYRLLCLKYPLPPSSPPPDLPEFKVTGVLLDLNSPSSIETIKLLLSKSRIHVFDTELAVKKCIDQCKIETPQPVEGKPNDKPKNSKNKTIDGSKQLKGKKKKDKKMSKKDKLNDGKMENLECIEDIIKVVNKETQTSIISVKEEETTRTPLGLLGEQVNNKLKEGKNLDDCDVASIIVEYVKTLEEYDGWLLLNYPTTIEQAFGLELALTAKKIPAEHFDSEVFKLLSEKETDEFSNSRKSRLLDLPDESESQPFESYFKVFIMIRAEDNEVVQGVNKMFEDGKSIYEVDNEYEEVHENSDLLDKFYRNFDIYSNFNLKTPDLNSLKRLARVILQENGIEAKQSGDLFGEDILSKLTIGKKSPKTVKAAKGGKESKGKVKKGIKKGDLNKKSNDINQDNVEVIHTGHCETDLKTTDSATNINLPPPQPSENQMSIVKFATLPLNNEFGIFLATMWENIETCYINSLKNALFENRFINLRLHPYCVYVEKELKKVIEQPDSKQNIVNNFQEQFNSVSEELRALTEMKSQLHCRVLKLQQDLWKITDERKREVEEKRQDLIHENWLVNEICLLINSFLSLIQIEVERSFQVLQLVNDYFMNTLEKMPSTLKVHPEMVNIDRINAESFLNTIQKLSGDSTFENNDGDKIDKHNFIANSLVSCLDEQKTIDMLEKILSERIKDVKSNFTSILNVFHGQNKSENIEVSKSNKAEVISKSPTRKKQSSIKPKKESVKNKLSTNSRKSEQEVKNNISVKDMIIEAWKHTINDEAERLDFRIDLIYQTAKENVMEFYCFVEAVFCNRYKSLLSRYNNEISNINAVCDYIRMAIEEESSLNHQLILGQDRHFIGIRGDAENFKQQSSALRELKEDFHECLFTIKQLNQLLLIFKISAPLGVVRKQPLCFMFQDLMLLESSEHFPFLPKMWNSLNELQLRNVFDEIFGPEFGVDWKDFIIYNLEIPYPKVDDILCLRKQFLIYDLEETELISVERYDEINLWFESELPDSPEQGLRFALVKKLLSEMFKVDENHINYTALLLYFCKDLDPVNGLKKALSLTLGRNVIVTQSELDMVLQNEEEINNVVVSLLGEIIDSIVILREAAQVYEIVETPSQSFLTCDVSSKSSTWQSIRSLNSGRFGSLKSNSQLDSHLSSKHDDDGQAFNKNITNTLQITKSWVTRIPITAVLSVLNASFFFQDRRFELKTQYLSCLEEQGDEDGMIEAYNLVNLPCIKKLFTMTNKFKISKPCDIVMRTVLKK